MAVTYSTACKTARMNAVVSQIDAGAGTSTIEIGTSGMGTVLAVFFVPVFFFVVLKLFKTKPRLLGAQVEEQESELRDRENKDMIYSEAFPEITHDADSNEGAPKGTTDKKCIFLSKTDYDK